MAHVHKAKHKTTRSSTISPGAPGTKSTTQSYKYKRKPKGAPAGYKAPVAAKTTTTTATAPGPTTRQSYVTYENTEVSRPSIPTSAMGAAGTAISVATPNQSPVPQGKAELVFAAGMALIIMSGFSQGYIQPVLDMITNGKNMKSKSKDARVGMVVLGGEFLFLLALTAISEGSEGFSNVALALIFVLFLVWGIGNVKTSTKWVDFITGKAKNI